MEKGAIGKYYFFNHFGKVRSVSLVARLLFDKKYWMRICFAILWCIPSIFSSKYLQFLNYCFRQSIDLYSSVPSPSIGFLGTPSLSRLGSSFLSSSLTRRHTPETLPFLAKPPVPTYAEQQQQQQQRRSSHSLLPSIHSRRSSIRKDEKSRVSHEHHPMSRHSSFSQAVLNGKYGQGTCYLLLTFTA